MRFLICFFASSMVCFSRVNETIEQCTKRYGESTELKPRLPQTVQKLFLKDDYFILIEFYENRSYAIEYYRRDDQKLTLAEVSSFQSIYSEKWQSPTNISDFQEILSEDGTMSMFIELNTYKRCRIINNAVSKKVVNLYFEIQRKDAEATKAKIKEGF